MTKAYLSDLTQAQWARLRREVFAGYPESIRDVVNGILYRQRSCVVWWLVPECYPPADVLERYFKQWQQDGTWENLHRMVPRSGRLPQSTPATRASRFQPLTWLRRTMARSLRRVPGGLTLLAVGRLPIQFAQAAQRAASAHHRWVWRFHTVIGRADKRLLAKSYLAAVNGYSRANKMASWHPHPLMGRAQANFELKRYDEVISDCQHALVAPSITRQLRHNAHALIARSIALSGGDLDRAVRHQTEAWWSHDINPGSLPDPVGPVTQLDSLMTAYNDLAECLINLHMAFPVALELYRRKPAAQTAYAARAREYVKPPELLLSPDWVRNIGHTAYLDTLAKMRLMGWESWDRMALLAPPQATANLHYAKYWAGHYDVITDARLIESLTSAARSFGPRVANMIRLPDGTERYFLEALGVVQEAWERENRPPLLKLTREDQDFGQRMLRRLGLPADAWFVCLHVREPGYHKEHGNNHQSHRNANIRSYLPAISEITARGGWVIRMGDPTMSKLPRMPGVVDFAHSRLKSAQADVFLCGACRFFVGVASGLCQIPTTFGRPCVLTNWVSNALPLYSRDDVFLPKLLRRRGVSVPLTFAEMYSPIPRQAGYSGQFLHEQKLKVIDNSPEDIRAVVLEMLDRLDGREVLSLDDEARQAQFAAILRENGVDGFSRVGREFLRRHTYLLPARREVLVRAIA